MKHQTFSLTRKSGDSIEAFNSNSSYLDDLLNIHNVHCGHMVDRIYPAELQWNKANSSDTEEQLLDLNISTSNGTVSTNVYDKRVNASFD